jgi:branched-chain amino acid transport system substrate-binding protein
VQRDKVDVVIGTVHTGVAMGMAKVLRESGTLWINPNAGADEVTGALCAPNIFRTSFSNWQNTYALGKVVKAKGHKTAVFITWKYAAGEQMMPASRNPSRSRAARWSRSCSCPSRRSSSRRC